MISSPGKYGSDFVIGAWPCPIGVSFGFAKERPLVIDHQVVAKPTFYLTLNFDRRVMAGAPAARFLSALIRRLENPD